MAVYFDSGADFWSPGAPWHDLPPVDWDDWFLPGVSAARQERGGTARGRQYVLAPVDGSALYVRQGAGGPVPEGRPAVDLDFQLQAVALNLSREALLRCTPTRYPG